MKNKTDLQEIMIAIDNYFLGMYHRDINRLRKAFHATAYLFGHLEGKFVHFSLEQWFARLELRPVPAETGELYDMKIISIDKTQEVAAVKVAVLLRGLRFTDYLTLMQVDGRWVILNKAFHHD